jgi:cyclopropane fatty-acyl-phospholipid synthase-like methyltransferase
VGFVAVNAEQAEDWNGASGRGFIEQRERHEQMLGRLTARLLAAARIQDGENVLDVGCGCGDATILAARATGSGHALGADFHPHEHRVPRNGLEMTTGRRRFP